VVALVQAQLLGNTRASEKNHDHICTLCAGQFAPGNLFNVAGGRWALSIALARRARTANVVSRAASLPVHVTMLKSNPRARKFYERRGYQLSGEGRHHDHLVWPYRSLNPDASPVSLVH